MQRDFWSRFYIIIVASFMFFSLKVIANGDLQLSELRCHRENSDDVVMIELENCASGALDISSYCLVDSRGLTYTFPEQTKVSADGIIVVVMGDPGDVDCPMNENAVWLFCDEPWRGNFLKNRGWEECALYRSTTKTAADLVDFVQWGHRLFAPVTISAAEKAWKDAHHGGYFLCTFCILDGDQGISYEDTLATLPGEEFEGNYARWFGLSPEDCSLGVKNSWPTPVLLSGVGGQYQTAREDEIERERYRLSYCWRGRLGKNGQYRLQISQDPKFQMIEAETVVKEPHCEVEVGNGIFYARVRWENGEQIGKWAVEHEYMVLGYYSSRFVEDLSEKE